MEKAVEMTKYTWKLTISFNIFYSCVNSQVFSFPFGFSMVFFYVSAGVFINCKIGLGFSKILSTLSVKWIVDHHWY